MVPGGRVLVTLQLPGNKVRPTAAFLHLAEAANHL
jgi:hypothetical protein